jgi:arginine-tRNA-protein transferase
MDHIERANQLGLPYVYLGYWIEGSDRMAYKSRFRPLERLTPQGWLRFDADGTADVDAAQQMLSV